MNLDSLSITLSQISYLVKNLSKRNYKSSVQELTELVSTHGQEADSYLLRCLLSEIDLNSDAVRAPNNKDFQQVQLLTQECTVLLRKPALVSLLVNAVDKSVQNNKIKNPAQLLPTLSKILKLTPVQEVVFGLTLLHSSYQVVSESALYFIKQKLPILIKNYSSEDTRHKEGGLHDTTPEVLHFILSDLFFPKEKTFLGISLETKELLISSLRRDFSKELVPVVLAPVLYSDIDYNFKMDKISQEPSIMTSNLIDDSLHTLIREVGYAFCSTVEDGRQQMSTLGMRDLSASGVARILIMMVRTCSGIDEVSCPTFWANSEQNSEKLLDSSSQTKGWNMENFTQVLKEFNPNLSWIEVIRELDNADLVIRERKALLLLFTALRFGLQHQGFHHDQFPVEILYRRWKHPEAQLSLISQIIKNPDIFCFADYTYHSVSIDMLKVTPEIDNKEIATWRSLNLLEVLLYLADRGLASQVQDVLKFPIQHCGDILFLGLIQINQNMTIYRQELITNMLPLFLTNHQNSSVILHQAWNSQASGIRQIITHYMAEWYLRAENDQTRLSRILDIAHDLKALAHLLNLQTFPFIIDLACLAARREYLKLDKWLTDKIREYGEGFVASLLKVLQRRCPQLFGSSYKEEIYPKAPPLPQDTVVTIINCLQACVGNLSSETNETVLSLITNCNFLVNKSRQAPSNVFRSHRNLEQSFNPPMFPSGSSQVDPLINLGSTMNNLNLNGPQTNSNAFNLPAGIGPLSSNPGSPSRLISPSQNTGFTLLPQMNGMNAQVNHVPSSLVNNSITSINSLAHIAPQSSAIEKLRLTETPSAASMIEFNSQVTKEIEDEANGYFQRIFNHPPQSALSPEEVIELLKKLHSSPNKRDRELFVCMIRNLFEECKFFYQYPDKELYITAQLFGGILAHGLLSQSPLFGTGLKYILDALRKPAHSKMFSFGVGALDQLKPMLKDIPKLCDFIMKLPSFQELPSTLIEYVEYGVQGQEPPHKAVSSNVSTLLSSPLFKTSMSANNSTNSSPVTKITTNSRPSIANATNIDTLLVATEKDEKIIMPPEALQEKVAFIFNNLSQLNIQTKGDEIKDLIREDHFGWLAQYMVMKRASIEANFHGLYSNFLDTLKLIEFDRLVLSETYRNIRVLLRCDKSTANFSDRTLLKNLGHWLGMITIAKHKPVLMDDLDVRMLLVESQKKGSQEMLYVVPFVAKILDSCIRSKIFKPPNPWTMSIVCLLAEIHQLPQLKLNLKFEIEVLLKSLQLDLATVKNTNYLKEGVLVENMEHQLSNKPKTHTPSPASTPVMTQALTPSSQNSAASSVILSSAASSTSVTPSLVNNPPPTNEEIIMQMAQLPLGNTSAVAGTSNNLLTPVAPSIPEPKYNLTTFNISTVSSLGALVTINGQLPLFQNFPSLKQYVRPVFERCLQEWIGPVTDRSTRISLNTTELIIKGDFALDPDETRMRLASHYLARNLTAGLSMVTTREQIMHSFTLNLKSTMMNILMKTEGFQQYTSLQQKELVDQAVDASVGDNIDLVCAFVQKTAMDRAVVEIDRRLHNEYEKRKSARMEGRRYCDSHVLTYQAERMPEQVRLKVGGVGQQQMIVYDEFAKKIPGFQIMTDRDIAIFASNNKQIVAALGTNDDMPLYDKLTSDLEMCLQSMTMQGILANNSSQSNYIHTIVELLTTLKRNGSRDTITAVSVIQKCIEGLLDCITQSTTDPEFGMRYRDFYMRTLKVFQDSKTFGLHWTNKTATRILVEYREEYRFNLEIVDLLARVHLLYFPLYDAHLAQSMENGLNFVAVAFAMQLLQYYLVDRKGSVRLTDQDLPHTIESLYRILNHSRHPPEGLASLLEKVKLNHSGSTTNSAIEYANVSHIHSGILQTRDNDDPPGLLETTEVLLRDWLTTYQSTPINKDHSKIFTAFIQQLNLNGVLKSDDLMTRFFRQSIHIVISIYYRALASGEMNSLGRIKVFHTIDGCCKLMAMLVKYSGDSNNFNPKLNLLNKILGVLIGIMLQDSEQRGVDFYHLPYHRIFSMLFMELNCIDDALDIINSQILQAFTHTYHILRPSKVPSFAYAWLELISHRLFINRILLAIPQQRGWPMYAQLIIDLFKFLSPFLRNAELAKPVSTLYKGTLRVLLVLLHDFPDFLCDYHFGFCDVIPPNCIQLRNLILSAFPRTMRLPDPFTPNLKVDVLPEIAQAPRILPNYMAEISSPSFKKELESYLKLRSPVTFLTELRTNLQVDSDIGSSYNISLINSLVLYVGSKAITEIRNKNLNPNMSTIAHSAHMDIFQNLAVDLDLEGRYVFFNAIVNQLRYPNSHTHYFSCVLLYLFSEANAEIIQEQITRILLERIIVNRPHPWGLLITFIELIKNPAYKFWDHDFVHCAPEIEKLFESVANSCMGRKPQSLSSANIENEQAAEQQ